MWQHREENDLQVILFFFFLSLWSCYLKWPPPLAVKISGVSVTCINRLHCTMVSAWGVIMTPAQAVCHSTLMVQKAHQRKRCSADLDPCTGPILLKSSKALQRANGAKCFSSSASSPLCAYQKRKLHSPALVLMDFFICTRLRRRAGYSVQ